MKKYKIAVLDDYQNVALRSDWRPWWHSTGERVKPVRLEVRDEATAKAVVQLNTAGVPAMAFAGTRTA